MPRAYPGPGDFYGDEYPGMEDVLLNWTVPGPHPLIRVEVDTVIDRPDLGPGRSTRVTAGDHIPVELETFPRHPA